MADRMPYQAGYQLVRLTLRLLGGLLSGWLICLSLSACQADSDSGKQTDLLTTQTLAGTYLLTTILPVTEGQVRSRSDDSVLVAYTKSLEYSLYSFSPDGTGYRLVNGVLHESRYILAQTELRVAGDVFHQLSLGRQALAMTLRRRVNGRLVALRCKAYRLNLSTDQLRFTALARAAFTHPVQSETKAQIRERVKNSLYFYSLFFRTIYTNQFNQFKPAAISLPIRYYNGGIRVPTAFDSTASWTSVYATTRDAEIAHEFFRRAANAVKTYPNGENVIHEYSLVLAKMAETL